MRVRCQQGRCHVTVVEEMAEFVARACIEDLSPARRVQLKIRMLDALGCAIAAMGGDPVRRVRTFVTDFSHARHCTLIGGGRSAPDRAALLNGALIRYLDFNDSYVAARETCNPSDNLGAVLAAAELGNCDGTTLLIALAVAYQVQCRLSDAAPVRQRGFDHTTHLAYSVAAGVARALSLDTREIANAIAISGAALNALRVTRTGALSHWKGLAAPFAASAAMEATLLAQRGITGPEEVFEGNKGFMQSVAGPFAIDWAREGMDRIERTITKRYNAEIHSQTAIETALELQEAHGFAASDIEKIDVDVFDVAHRIIGGGEEGDKTLVFTKEDADHSLPYLIAVALLDRGVMPAQFEPERIQRADVQALLCRVVVHPHAEYTGRFPEEMPSGVTVTLRDGRVIARARSDYLGFHTRPMTWDDAVSKFTLLAAPSTSDLTCADITAAVRDLDQITVAELTRVLGYLEVPTRRPPVSQAAIATR
ncbi:MAG: MmgE/PrpD family protein [Gemmatimonadaceae bacterium]